MREIRIEDVPEELYLRLEGLAAREGLPLPELVLRELRTVVGQSEPRERAAGAGAPSSAALTPSPAEAVRAERDAR